MDLMMIFPPLCNHEHAHIGIPLLKSYITSKGYEECTSRDYNVVIMDRFLSGIMTGEKKTLFGSTKQDVLTNYRTGQRILKGETATDRLKTTWAGEMIYRYLSIAGDCISKLSFDPISMDKVEEEFLRTENIVVDNPVYQYIEEEVVPEILSINPKVLGFSITYASQVLYTLEICRKLRAVRPEIKIFFGGAIVSIFWQAFVHRPSFAKCFDVIIREQGEVALFQLMEFWTKGAGSLQTIQNLVYLDVCGDVKYNPIGGNISMNLIPLPDYSDFPIDAYAYPKLPYQMTRGCYWGKCSFCGHRGCNNTYLVANKDKVVAELKELRERYGVRMFHFVDDAILPRYLVDIANRIIDEKIDIIYSAFLRTEKGFTKENCKVLFQSGLRSVLYGIESGNARILKMMEKGLTTETMKEVLKNFHDAGVSNHLSCIVGFPTETREEAQETFQFLLENKDIYHKAYLTPFGLFSDMMEDKEKYSLDEVDINNPMRHDIEGYVGFEYDYKRNEGMSIEEYLQVLKEGRELIESVPPGGNYFSKSL